MDIAELVGYLKNKNILTARLTAVYNRHCFEHNADFEVCQHPACRVAVAIEKRHGLELYLPSNVGDSQSPTSAKTGESGASAKP